MTTQQKRGVSVADHSEQSESAGLVVATLRLGTGTRAAVRRHDRFLLLDDLDVGALLQRPDWSAIAASQDESGQAVPVDRADFAPLVLAPRKVLCCGHNYRGHIAEMGRAMPEHPTIFAKFADTLTGADDPIVIDVPGGGDTVDWEAELAVVVGAPIHQADRAQAQAAIAGYTVANDVSIRAWQRHTGQWLPGKAVDATTPLGPVLVTPDEFDPAAGAAIRCVVNGETVQESTVDDLLFSAADLLVYLSAFTALAPGDVVLTGTPAGVGAGHQPARYLADGDTVVSEIDGIGRCTNIIRIQGGRSA